MADRAHGVTAVRRATWLTALLLVLALVGAACTSGSDEPAPGPDSSTPVKQSKLTFGVWGPEDELAAYQSVVDDFNARSKESQVTLQSFPDQPALVRAIEGDDPPDIYLLGRRDLAQVLEAKKNRPVDDLLDERGVDFGDGYSRDALEAFSADRRLQCMPYGVSPMVIYYNTRLVRFGRMANRGLAVPPTDTDPAVGQHSYWNYDTFTAAAEFATRPARGTRGVYIAPTLAGLGPLITSGGGSVFDDDEDPTSLAFSDDGSRSALDRTLQLLRNPNVTLTPAQLAQADPITWFKRGKLGMIAGYRSLVPELRATKDLDFDVMPMPTLDSQNTIADFTGICLSAKAASIPEGADFLVHATSAASVAQVAQAGYLAPANNAVALSDDFLQPDQLPAHSNVFVRGLRAVKIPPLLDDWDALDNAVSASLAQLVSVPLLDLEALTTQIDEESRTVLDPEAASESPSTDSDSDG